MSSRLILIAIACAVLSAALPAQQPSTAGAASVSQKGVPLPTDITGIRHNTGQSVTPYFEGWIRNADGTFDLVFGYFNRNYVEEFAIPAGFDHASLAEIHRREPIWRLEMILNCRLADHVHAARASGSLLISHEPEYCVKSDVQEMHAAGIAVLLPFLSLARRLVGPAAAELATFLLAVSPLHVQASTTAASEALYLLLWVCELERLLTALDCRRLRTFAIAGLLASLAAVTRYDAWLALPLTVAAAFAFHQDDRRAILPGLAVFSLIKPRAVTK